jgi:glycosyltransferase involved in cell wall biosynthesis
LRLREWLERLVVARADAVVLNTPLLKDEFAACYGPDLARKFHTVTNGYDAEHLMPFLRPALRRSSRLVLTHAGSLYRQRDPRPLVHALASAIRKGRIAADQIELHFVGTVSPEFRLADTVRELELGEAVRLTPPVPHERCLQYLLESDVLIVIQPGTVLQVPVKLYEYLPFLKPILALAPAGALSTIAEASGLGVVVPPEDVEGIEDALCNLYDHRHSLGERFTPDSAYIDGFEGGAVSRQLQTIFENLPVRRQ